jgi:transmembrane sensor
MTEAIQIEQKIALETIEWYLSLSESDADHVLRQQWQKWLEADARHQLAWSRIEQVNNELSSLSSPLSRAVTHQSFDKAAKSRRHFLQSLAGIAIISGGSWALLKNDTFLSPLMADYHTGTAETRQVTLADGTHVYMNANTAFSVQYSEQQRYLTLLAGDVVITTGKDNRPFLLHTPWADLQPLGTRFYVRQRENQALLAVYEGAVNIIRQDRFPTLLIKAGHQISFAADQSGSVVVAREEALAWQQHMLIADNMALADVLTELENYHHGWLRCDPKIATRRVSGTYPLMDIEQVLRALSATLQIELVYRTRYWIMLRPKQTV